MRCTCTFRIVFYLSQFRLNVCRKTSVLQGDADIVQNLNDNTCSSTKEKLITKLIPSIVVLHETKQSKFSLTSCFFCCVLPLRSVFKVRAPDSKSAALVSLWTHERKTLGSKWEEEYITFSANVQKIYHLLKKNNNKERDIAYDEQVYLAYWGPNPGTSPLKLENLLKLQWLAAGTYYPWHW